MFKHFSNKEAFAKHLRGIITRLAPNSLSWRTWERLANITEHIDYGCVFNKSGRCKNKHFPKLSSIPKVRLVFKRCCCEHCNDGYLERIPKSAEKEILSLWSPHSGFYRKGKGCILPRKWRSEVCLVFWCASNYLSKPSETYYYIDFRGFFRRRRKIPRTRDILRRLKKEGILKQGNVV